MNKILKHGIYSLTAAALLVGCSTKEVEYDATAPAAQSNLVQVQQPVTSTDTKLDAIAGSNETVVESTVDSTSSNSSETMNLDKIKTNGINMVQSEVNGQVVTLKSVHFAFDKYDLNDQMRQIATDNAAKIEKVNQNVESLKIKLEGNCDEWGTDEYNYALGLKRAKTVKDALIADGISEDKISMVSFGESNPVCKDRNVACWKLNRRVDYKLLP